MGVTLGAPVGVRTAAPAPRQRQRHNNRRRAMTLTGPAIERVRFRGNRKVGDDAIRVRLSGRDAARRRQAAGSARDVEDGFFATSTSRRDWAR
jgi:hypothetical protein